MLALIGAIVAVGALLLVLIRPANGVTAWAALVGLGLGAVVGAANLLSLDTARQGVEAQSRSATFDIAWGLVLVVVAGVIGTVCAALVVRQAD